MDALVYIAGLPFVFVPFLLVAQVGQIVSRSLLGVPRRTAWRTAAVLAAIATALFTVFDLFID